MFWFHCQPNGTPERMTDIEGQVRWEGVNSAILKIELLISTRLIFFQRNHDKFTIL
ncbi:RHS domain-containing protein [Enterobacter sp. 01-M-03-SI-ECC_S142]|uniref:RHS domain-containing protein n=1 Tax=Enterobacter TaxID=547 RepID=UPI00215D189E|nr:MULTISPECIES: RHS domain-containing protein [Enterobacter cloacae complex]MEC5766051.1 RHS domain-containing protein [Enterobacter chengduensis]